MRQPALEDLSFALDDAHSLHLQMWFEAPQALKFMGSLKSCWSVITAKTSSAFVISVILNGQKTAGILYIFNSHFHCQPQKAFLSYLHVKALPKTHLYIEVTLTTLCLNKWWKET